MSGGAMRSATGTRPEEALLLGERIGTGRSAETFRLGSDRILKLYRKSVGGEAVEAEFAATMLAWSSGLPVARPYAIREHRGRRGIEFAHLSGETIVRQPLRKPLRFVLAFRQLARLQAAVHACPAPGLPSQRDGLRSRIEAARVSDAIRGAALRALERLPDGDRLCHGDLHAENVIRTAEGLRIIDWAFATGGNPAADAARTLATIRYGDFETGRLSTWLHLGALRTVMAAGYLRWYAKASGLPPAEIGAWALPVLTARLAGGAMRSEDELQRAVARLAAP